jgi:hypothetical protein
MIEHTQTTPAPVSDGIVLNPPVPDRQYKDRVFRMIFREKENALALYNALNNTSYEDEEELTITTLESALYLGLKNDVSFLLHDQLSLYEHQSTWNPNLPLRDLFYVSSVYSDLTKSKNLYGSKLVMIPAPMFVVFYNGLTPIPERMTLKLSDAYLQQSEAMDATLDLKVLVLNINPGFNHELMKKCKMLQDYSIFVSKVRTYREALPLAQAVEKTIDDCIAEDILREFLLKNRAEVTKMSIFEYNEEQHMQMERRDAMADGIQIGIQRGEHLTFIRQIQKKLARSMSTEEIADALEADPVYVQKIAELLKQHPELDDAGIYELWEKEKSSNP